MQSFKNFRSRATFLASSSSFPASSSSSSSRSFADHPAIWKTPKNDSGNRVGGQNLQKFGSLGLLYECANYGGLGKYDEISMFCISSAFLFFLNVGFKASLIAAAKALRSTVLSFGNSCFNTLIDFITFDL